VKPAATAVPVSPAESRATPPACPPSSTMSTETNSLDPKPTESSRMPSPETTALMPVISVKVLIWVAMSSVAVPEAKVNSRLPMEPATSKTRRASVARRSNGPGTNLRNPGPVEGFAQGCR